MNYRHLLKIDCTGELKVTAIATNQLSILNSKFSKRLHLMNIFTYLALLMGSMSFRDGAMLRNRDIAASLSVCVGY